MTATELLREQNAAGKYLCIGLDPDRAKLPTQLLARADEDIPSKHPLFLFGQEIVEATYKVAAAYKPNSAFYESWGWRGVRAMEDLVAFIKQFAPTIPKIDDGKRGDIGNTNRHYGQSVFTALGFDALTVHNYTGYEGGMDALLQQHPHKLFYVLCRTSNPGARELQDRIDQQTGLPMWQFVAHRVVEHWNQYGNCGLVVGATYPDDLLWVRQTFGPDLPILAPGIGTQGGEAEAVLAGKGMTVFNVSRDIVHASTGEDFVQAAWAKAIHYDNRFQELLEN